MLSSSIAVATGCLSRFWPRWGVLLSTSSVSASSIAGVIIGVGRRHNSVTVGQIGLVTAAFSTCLMGFGVLFLWRYAGTVLAIGSASLRPRYHYIKFFIDAVKGNHVAVR